MRLNISLDVVNGLLGDVPRQFELASVLEAQSHLDEFNDAIHSAESASNSSIWLDSLAMLEDSINATTNMTASEVRVTKYLFVVFIFFLSFFLSFFLFCVVSCKCSFALDILIDSALKILRLQEHKFR